MEKKKILIFTGMHCLKYGAMEKYFINIIKQCNFYNFQTILQYEAYPESFDYIKELNNLGAQFIVKPTHVKPLFSLLNCISLISKIRPVIIHNHFVSNHAKLFIPIIAKLFRSKKIIFTVHNLIGYQVKHHIRFAYNLYNHILPVSNAVLKDLTICGVNSTILKTHYLGLFDYKKNSEDIRKKWRCKFNISNETIVLSCIAFDAKFKGNDILLESIKILKDKNIKIHFISVGVDPKISKLPTLAKTLGIDDCVHWAGIVDNGCEVLNAADIYVQPSRADEGLPLALMEAMSLRLPIVSTSVSGNIEAIIDGISGIVSNPNPNDLSFSIEKMILLKNKWNDFTEEGYKHFLKYFEGTESVKKLLNNYYF